MNIKKRWGSVFCCSVWLLVRALICQQLEFGPICLQFDMECVLDCYKEFYFSKGGHKTLPNWKNMSLQLCVPLLSVNMMFFQLIMMKCLTWLTATAATSKTIFSIRHKYFLLVINNGNYCLARFETAISPPNCRTFYSSLSTHTWARLHNLSLLSRVLAEQTRRAFLSTQLPSLADINGVNDTLTDVRNLDGFL